MKYYYIGLMLASSANSDSGVAVINKDNEIVFVDKLFTMKDVEFFFENFSNLSQARICISLPTDNTMLNGKWRVLSKFYQLLGFEKKMLNKNNWTQRYSTRGCELFNNLTEKNIAINRYELFLTRQALGLSFAYKERSPADCKSLQSALRMKYGFTTLPTNMMPMGQLEALVGAVLAKNIEEGKTTDLNPLFNFNGIDVIRG